MGKHATESYVTTAIAGVSVPTVGMTAPSGYMISPSGVLSVGATACTSGRVYLHAIDVYASVTVDALVVSVTTAGAGGTWTMTGGLYPSSSNGFPNATAGPLASASFTTAATTTGVKVGTFSSIALTPGRYWTALLYVSTVAPTTIPILSCDTNNTQGIARATSLVPGGTARGYYHGSQTSLPTTTWTTANLTTSITSDVPVMGLRVA